MINFFVKAWDSNKDKLEKYIRNNEQNKYGQCYEDLFKTLIDNVINGYNDVDFSSDIKTIDYGDYQGTLILTFANSAYQPCDSETFYTIVSYGSCSGCDTLQSIVSYEYDSKPNEDQVREYMLLCLHMIQNIKCFGDINSNWRLKELN